MLPPSDGISPSFNPADASNQSDKSGHALKETNVVSTRDNPEPSETGSANPTLSVKGWAGGEWNKEAFEKEMWCYEIFFGYGYTEAVGSNNSFNPYDRFCDSLVGGKTGRNERHRQNLQNVWSFQRSSSYASTCRTFCNL